MDHIRIHSNQAPDREVTATPYCSLRSLNGRAVQANFNTLSCQDTDNADFKYVAFDLITKITYVEISLVP